MSQEPRGWKKDVILHRLKTCATHCSVNDGLLGNHGQDVDSIIHDLPFARESEMMIPFDFHFLGTGGSSTNYQLFTNKLISGYHPCFVELCRRFVFNDRTE